MISLQRKRLLKRQAVSGVAAVRKTEAVSRTTQVAHSTVAVGDADVPVVDVAADATSVAADMPGVQDDVAQAATDAYDASMNVGEALDAAEQAAVEAAAATETALGFARYSQIDGGSIVPPLPGDGPRVGAELVRIDVDQHPYQVDVWNGTAWAKSQILADQILVLGEDGTVQIENGRIVSPTVIGGEFYGNSFEGSEFRLATVISETETLFDGCEVVGSWTARSNNPTPLTRTTAQKKSGTYSLLGATVAGAPNYRWGRRPVPAMAFPRGGYCSVWVRSTVATSVTISAHPAARTLPIAANVWTEVRGEIPAGASPTNFELYSAQSSGTGTLYIDELRFVSYGSLDGGASILRDGTGRAIVRSLAPDSSAATLEDGQSRVARGAASIVARVQDVSGALRPVQVLEGPTSLGGQAFLETSAGVGGAQLSLSSSDSTLPVPSSLQFGLDNSVTVFAASRVLLNSPSVRFAGDIDWVYPTLLHGTNLAGNPFGYRRVAGKIEFRGRVGYMTALTPIFRMPAGYRIDGGADNVFVLDSGGVNRFNVRSDGYLQSQTGGDNNVSFAQLTYPVAAA
ncbi:hypothetical protein MUN76_15395 [Leucobacter rhizosphaerae]|uniref:Minor tail protein n=1 Tax=Leucobacter rhizosphaerae TaxID=2932245 RepID=A0ABY4FVQ9_9MICO|nr:hypothetical protein [Leucobacter rhizosphaerae]UOQ60393.1 hypothetical protein MUN76_15395 [Leucobacter rhizosphaerae]